MLFCVGVCVWSGFRDFIFSPNVHSKVLSSSLLSSPLLSSPLLSSPLLSSRSKFPTVVLVSNALSHAARELDCRQMEVVRACTTVMPQFNRIFFFLIESNLSMALLPCQMPQCAVCPSKVPPTRNFAVSLWGSLTIQPKPHTVSLLGFFCSLIFLERFPVLCYTFHLTTWEPTSTQT